MPDPAQIIADTILKPPPQTGWHDENFEWHYSIVMGNRGAPDLARHIAEAAVQALKDAGVTLVPPAGPGPVLPSPAQVRSWLASHQWTQGGLGEAATSWYPPVRGRGVLIPHEGGTPAEISGAIERIADRGRVPYDQVLAEMLTHAGE